MVPDESPDDRKGRESAPLGELAERIRARRAQEDAGTAQSSPGIVEDSRLDEFFQETPGADADVGDLWSADQTPHSLDDGAEAAEAPDEHRVSKRAYCERCQYFSSPPEVECSHPGTTIVEFVDIDHALVRNCPVVEERRALGQEDLPPMTPGTFGNR